jgi:peptidyl-prolyl cis-trans isomerase SurA
MRLANIFMVSLLTAAAATSALAQSVFMPGISTTGPVFQPGQSVTTTGPINQPPPAAQPPAKAQAAKPKPKPKPTTTAAIEQDGGAVAKGGQAIAILVNDEPITAYEIELRTRFLTLSANVGQQAQESFKRIATSEATNAKLKAIFEQTIRENQGKSREEIVAIFEKRKIEFAQGLQRQALEGARAGLAPKFRKEAQEELIEERLKLQEARKLGVEISEEDLNRIMKGIAERNKVTEAQFAQNVKSMGGDISVMRARFAANLAWREVVRRKFAAQININQREVERLMAASTSSEADTVELQIQKITLPLPAKLDQAGLAQRLADADALRRKFGGCKMTGQLAQTLPGAKFEDLKYIKPSTVSEPARSFLLNARDGDMLPPQTSGGGVDIYTVCARRSLKPDEKKREEAQQELQSREFELLAKRHLRDLRQDAHIEIR